MNLIKNLKNNIIFKILLITISTIIIWINSVIFSLIITKIEPMYSGLTPIFSYPNLIDLLIKTLPFLVLSLTVPILFANNKLKSIWLFFTILILSFSLILSLFINRNKLLLEPINTASSDIINIIDSTNTTLDTVNIKENYEDSGYAIYTPPSNDNIKSLNSLNYDTLTYISKIVFKAFKFILEIEILISFIFFSIFSIIILHLYIKKEY